MSSGRLVPERYLAEAFYRYGDIRQLDIYDAERFAAFAKDRGIRLVTRAPEVLRLWQAGLLRADFVLTDEPLDVNGLVLVSDTASDECWYADERAPLLSERGVLDCATALTEPASNITRISIRSAYMFSITSHGSSVSVTK